MGSHIGKVLLLVVITTFSSFATDASDGPDAVVERFQDRLLTVMKTAKRSSVQTRYDALRPAVQDAFHLPVMIRIAMGAHWDKADDAQREALADAFQHMNIATLASLITGYGNETFERLGQTPGPQNTRLVNTQLVSPDGSKIRLAYVARQFGTDWKLVDVIVDNGISELSVRRSEYQRALSSGGVDGLIAVLNAKASTLLMPTAKPGS
jgi:phospholipid transport system substrate-binding protein